MNQGGSIPPSFDHQHYHQANLGQIHQEYPSWTGVPPPPSFPPHQVSGPLGQHDYGQQQLPQSYSGYPPSVNYGYSPQACGNVSSDKPQNANRGYSTGTEYRPYNLGMGSQRRHYMSSNLEEPVMNINQSNMESPSNCNVPNPYSKSNEEGPEGVPISARFPTEMKPSPATGSNFSQFMAQSDAERDGQGQLLNLGDGRVEYMNTTNPAQSEVSHKSDERISTDSIAVPALPGSRPVRPTAHVKGGGIHEKGRKMPVESKAGKGSRKKGKGAPPKDQSDRRMKSEESIKLLKDKETKKLASTLRTCETHMRDLLKKEDKGKRTLRKMLHDNKLLKVHVYDDDERLMLLLEPGNTEELEKWQKGRLADFKYIERLANNSTSRKKTENTKRGNKSKAMERAEDAENTFNSMYNDINGYIRQFWNGYHCQECQNRLGFITGKIEMCGHLSVEEGAQSSSVNTPTQKFRAKLSKQTRENEKKCADYQNLIEEVQELRVHLGLLRASTTPGMVGFLDSTGSVAETTTAHRGPNTIRPNLYQAPGPEQPQERSQLTSIRTVPTRGLNGEEIDEQHQEDLQETLLQNVPPSMGDFPPGQEPNQLAIQYTQAQKCVDVASEVMEIDKIRLRNDDIDRDFLERSLEGNLPARHKLAILKEIVTTCEQCSHKVHEVKTVFLIKEYHERNFRSDLMNFSEMLSSVRQVNQYSRNESECILCKIQTKKKRGITQSSRSEFILLKRPPETLPFPDAEETVLGVNYAPVFFVQDTAIGLVPWKKYNEFWLFGTDTPDVPWIPGTPPPNCGKILYLLFKKKPKDG